MSIIATTMTEIRKTDLIRGAYAVAGMAVLGYGLWLAWPPLAYIVIGALMVLDSILARAQPKTPRNPKSGE